MFDGSQELLKVDLTGGFQGVTAANFYGPTGSLDAVEVSGSSTTTTVWTFADPAGNIETLASYDTGSSTWAVKHLRADEFGNVYATSGSILSDDLNAVPQYINGMQWDVATGLFLAGDHWYDSTAGRFLTPDAGTDGGGYAFVPTNPMDLANGYTSGGQATDWSKITGPGSFDTIGSIGFGLIDSTPVGWFISDDIRSQTNEGYYAGLGLGIVGQIALGNWSAGVLGATQATRWATIGAKAYRAYGVADAALSVGTSGYAVGDSLVNGKPFNPLSLVGFAPAAGFAVGTLKRAGKYLRTLDEVAPNSVIPNPGGRLGNAATRAKASEVEVDLMSRGFTEIEREVRFRPGSLGSGKERFADIVGRNPVTGETEIIQIGQTIKSDPRVPIIRERNALDDIIFSPDIRNYPNTTIRFVDVNRPGVIQP